MDINADMMKTAAELFVRQDMEVDYQIAQLSDEQCRRIVRRIFTRVLRGRHVLVFAVTQNDFRSAEKMSLVQDVCKDLLRAAFDDDTTIAIDCARHVAPVEAVEAKVKEMEAMETVEDWFSGL